MKEVNRCVECEWCRSDDEDEPITRGEGYICLRLGRRLSGRQLWARACRHFVAIR
jgi:hypothetical protein